MLRQVDQSEVLLLQGKDVCTVTVSPATGPIYPREKGKEEDTLYVRLGNTTRPLNPKQSPTHVTDVIARYCIDPTSAGRS